MQKISYIIAVIVVSSLLFVCYVLFSASTEHTRPLEVSIQPHTAKEQLELINAEEREESLKPSGPLVAFTEVTDAEAKVLFRNSAHAH